MWIHSLWPLVSVTGVIPLKFWTWLAFGESVAVGAEGGNQAGHHHFSGIRKGVEYRVVGKRFRQRPNALVQVGDTWVEHGDDLAHPMRQDDAGFEHGLVARRWDGFATLLPALVD